MNDTHFLSILNAISRQHELTFPVGSATESPTGALLDAWARFLEACIERGVDLGDPRWQRVALGEATAHTEFTLEATQDGPGDSEADFRVGLQLLLGLLGERRES